MTKEPYLNLPYEIKQKMSASKLDINITRKCNLKCEHCLCGDAQNVTITEEIIDAAMAQFSEIGMVRIILGETLLELDKLDYLITSINRHKVKVDGLSFVTNGTIKDARLTNILHKFIVLNPNRRAEIVISDDKFHDIERSKDALKFYKSTLTSRQDKNQIGYYLHSEGADLGIVGDITKGLKYSGRAENYIDSHVGQPFILPQNRFGNHIVNIKNNHIYCALLIDVKGQLGHTNDNSYDVSDRYVFGNILDESIYDILIRHNNTCTHTCAEFNTEFCNEDIKMGFRHDASQCLNIGLYSDMQLARVRRVWHIRDLARERFPALPSQEIIKLTPVPPHRITTEILCRNPISERVKRNSVLKLSQIYPDKTMDDIEGLVVTMWVLQLINSGKDLGVYPFHSDERILSSELFKKFEELEKKYINGELKWQMLVINACENIPDGFDTKYDPHAADEFKTIKQGTID